VVIAMDIVILGLTVLFFVLAASYVIGCERLR